jgi:hypothetical protein
MTAMKRYIIFLTAALVAACGSSEQTEPAQTEPHVLTEHEKALEKAKEAAAALEKAAGRTKDIVDETVEEIEKSRD